MIDITSIIEAVLILIGAIITCFVVPFVKSRTSLDQQKELLGWVKIAVAAAEQIYVGSGRGEEKKNYVFNWLLDHNVKVDDTKLNALIEAAVYALKNGTVDATDN